MLIVPILVDVFGAALLLASLPLLLELLALSVMASLPFRAAALPAAEGIKLAVIVPAHNEEKLISGCVRSILASAAPNVSVYVIAHNCEDRTAERAREAGAHVFTLRDGVGGKGTALDFGFTQAIGLGAEAVLVVDADSTVGLGTIRRVAAAFASGVEALQCRYEVGNAEVNARTRLASVAFLGMNVVRPLGRARLGLSCGIFGNGFGVRAEVLGRVPYVANSLVEDLEYHLHLIRARIRVSFLNEVGVFGEMPGGSAAAGSQRARWEGGRIRMRRMWTWPLIGLLFRGEVRVLEPLLDLLALPLGSGVMVFGVALLLGVASGTAWLWMYGLLGMLAVAGYVLVAATLGSDPWENLRALVAAPGFLVWKLGLITKTRRAAQGDAAWVRTARNVEGAGDVARDHFGQGAGPG